MKIRYFINLNDLGKCEKQYYIFTLVFLRKIQLE